MRRRREKGEEGLLCDPGSDCESYFVMVWFTLNLWIVRLMVLYRYEGQFDGGKCHGRGTYFYANGNR